jgi:hypothetical protein
VLFLVNASATMLDELTMVRTPGDSGERGRPYLAPTESRSEAEKRSAPKWLRAGQTLEQMLTALPTETNFASRCISTTA